MNVDQLLDQLGSHFNSCVFDAINNVARCERRYGDAIRGVYFFSQVDKLPDEGELERIQETVVAPSFYKAADDSRWNHFLVFVTTAPTKDATVEERSSFYRAKNRVEAEKSYARKLVFDDYELGDFLDRSKAIVRPTLGANELQSIWTRTLANAGLYAITTKEPRAKVMRDIRAGQRPPAPPLAENEVAQTPEPFIPLSKLEIRKFGTRQLTGVFKLGLVNLIRGPNGVGKTSFLEAIEHFFCGATFRSGGETEHLDATISFLGRKPVNYAQRENSYYREKDLAWYGRSVNKDNRLYEGFARYNFMNTDAASELSRDSALRNIKDALAKIALGPDASQTWNRIIEFDSQIGKEITPLDKQIRQLNSQVKQLNERLAALRTLSPQALVQISALSAKLDDLDWPSDQRPGPSLLLRDFALYQPLVDLCSMDVSDAPAEIEAIAGEIVKNDEDLGFAKNIIASQQSNSNERVQIKNELELLNQRLSMHDRLSQYARVDFGVRLSKLREAEFALASLSRFQMGELEIGLVQEWIERKKTESVLLPQAMTIVQSSLDDRRKVLAEQIQLRAKATALMAERDALIAQLRILSHQYASHNVDLNACPVCNTEMSSSELLSRIDSQESSTAYVLSEEVPLPSDLETEIQGDHALSRLLTELMDFLPNGADTSCRLAVEEAWRTLGKQKDARADVSTITRDVARLNEGGFNNKEYEWLVVTCLPDFSGSVLESDVATSKLDELSGAIHSRVRTLGARLEELDAQLKNIDNEIEKLARRHACAANLAVIQSAANKRKAELSRFIEGIYRLPQRVQEKFMLDVRSLMLIASEVSADLAALSERIRQEQARTDELRVVEAALAKDQLELATLNVERENLEKVQLVLRELVNAHSLENGLAGFLTANQAVIQSVFAQIHSPNELRISTLSDCMLERVSSNESADLSQISTGQRAALMLSIFLTLNLSLRVGPKFMLVDDPVAHIDDLNSLAFLDYLANVAADGSRQIFFATADERLANLFAKKMGFLGPDAFQDIDLSRARRKGQQGPLH